MTRRALLAALLLAASLPAQAAGTCVATVLPVAFGNYNPVVSGSTDASGSVTVTCTLVLGVSFAPSYEIKINGGTYGAVAQRKMGLLASRLNYNLYTSSAYSAIWGDGSSGATVTGSFNIVLPALTDSRQHFIYGRIPGPQAVPAGLYGDTLTVTVTY